MPAPEHDRESSAQERLTLPQRIVSVIPRDAPLIASDLVVVLFAYLVALVLRFEGAVPTRYWHNFWRFALLALVLHLLTNHVFGLYRHMWRYASVHEARRVMMAGVAAGALLVIVGIQVGGRMNYLPLSSIVFGSVLSLLGFGGVRFQSRLFALRRRLDKGQRVRVLVMGAGEAGSMVLKDILRNPSLGLEPVGIVDDDVRKVGRALHGVKVLGGRAAIPSLVTHLKVDQILLSIPSATSEVVRDIAALCEESDVTLRILPSVGETLGRNVTARDIRDVRIEDLLGRQQVEMDTDAIRRMLHGRRVLITGAGGSIGSEIARQVLAFKPSLLVLLDHDETHLHDLQLELSVSEARTEVAVESVLADVRDQSRLFAVFFKHLPEVVFHAAAHKHVPFLEEYPEEAIRTNVIGTANVAEAAVASGVRKFVLISTDKAVKPASVMGASKWFAEQIVRSYEGSDTVFCAVRFGNVLGSRGSVIPTFFRQIAKGGPITVTDPSMARYFMSVQEAVQLVLQSATLSVGREVFTLDMGEPVPIIDLARKLIRLSGLVPERDVKIAITGRRAGEKLVEDIIAVEEEPLPSAHPSIVISRPAVPDQPSLRGAIRKLEVLAMEGRGQELSETIREFANQERRSARTQVSARD